MQNSSAINLLRVNHLVDKDMESVFQNMRGDIIGLDATVKPRGPIVRVRIHTPERRSVEILLTIPIYDYKVYVNTHIPSVQLVYADGSKARC